MKSNSYQLIHQLLELVKQMDDENIGNESTLEEFSGFLLTQLGRKGKGSGQTDSRFGANETIAQDMAYQLDNNIGRLFIYMSRYAKAYVKKALDGTSLQTPEDFTSLAILLTHDQLSKTELINYNLQEKASGTEVIRRLISAGLVKQWEHPEDRRSKLIAITSEGKKLLYTVFDDMNNVGKMIAGKLCLSEKLILQHLLQKLENFHHEHYLKKSIQTKADLKKLAASTSKI
jgi:DNA-binding MarR family transcriptional regulator